MSWIIRFRVLTAWSIPLIVIATCQGRATNQDREGALPSTLAANPRISPANQATGSQSNSAFSTDERESRGRAFPLNHIPLGARARALAQIEKAERDFELRFGRITIWYNIGPAAIDKSPYASYGQTSGRVTALAVDPSNSSHWLIGAAQGGIWETTDSGNTWNPRSDDQASLAMGAITFAPSDPSTVYAGTGEQNFRGDDYAGEGLLLSNDGGGHWAMLNDSFAQTSFSAIHVSPTDPRRLSVATVRGGAGVADAATGSNAPPSAPLRGVFVSSDGGATFTLALVGEATDLQAHPADFNHQYAGLGEIYGSPTNGVYRTLDGWATSTLIKGPWSNSASPSQMGRIVMALSPSDPNSLYVGIAQKRTAYVAGLVGIWRTRNAWDPTPVWTQLPNAPVYADGISSPRFWYHFYLLVHPRDPDSLYLSEYNVWHYSSAAWTSLGDSIHPDNHVMAPVYTGTDTVSLLVGNDGGVWLSDPLISGSWNNLNPGLAISQIYRGAVDPTSQSHLALAGTQDNGTAVYSGNRVWDFVEGGDGADCAISAADPKHQWALSYETDPGVDIFRTLNAGGFSGPAAGDISSGVLPFSTQFFVHFEKSPYNDDLLLAGTAQLWRCNDFFSGTIPRWSINSPVISTAGRPVPISAIAIAPLDTRGLVYAFGAEDGQLRITGNGGSTWSDPDPGNAVPNRYISGLAFSPIDTNVLYVTLSGFDEGTPGQPGHLFMTTNALAASPAWFNISPPVNLPNDCLVIDPNAPKSIYVGCDIGVWFTSDGGLTWGHYGPISGIPNVAVFDLRMNSSGQLTAFTHGRSAYLLARYFDRPIIDYLRPACLTCPKSPCLTCPYESWVNQGDPVELELSLRDIIPIDAVGLTVSILSSAQVRPINGTQFYGKVTGQGPAVSRSFTFRIEPGAVTATRVFSAASSITCGETVPVVFQLRDASNNLGRITVPFRVGVPTYPLVQDFERVREGTLPSGWVSSSSGHAVAWSSTRKPPPNTIIPPGGEDVIGFVPPPNVSVFTPASFIGQSYLTSASFTAATDRAELYFQQAFNLARDADGAVLEIAIGKRPFEDIVRAGGSFARSGYNTELSSHNPIQSRRAWSGNSGGWLPVTASLPPRAAGQPVRLRWRLATSHGLTNGFWSVDSVLVTEAHCPPPREKSSESGKH